MGPPNDDALTRRAFLAGGAALAVGSLVGCKDGQRSAPGTAAQAPQPARPAETAARTASADKPRRPNIVYIYADQHRGDALEPAGNTAIRTPSLAALAAAGVTFGRCYTNAPLCRPARSSMITGLYPREHGVWTNFRVPDQRGPSHVRRLRDEAGFRTAVVGKTHLHQGEGHLDAYRCILDNFGFDEVFELPDPGQAALIESSYSDWLSANTPRKAVDKYKRFQRYVLNYARRVKPASWDLPPPDDAPWLLGADDHLDRYTGRLAAKWLREVKSDRPFYLQVCFPGPHDPFDSPRAYRALYDRPDVVLPAGVTEPPDGALSHLVTQSIKFQNVLGITPEQKRRLQITYFGKVTFIDEAIGEVIAALEERGLLESTWIIYGSDHGEMLGDHQLVNKSVMYEQSVRIPCIVRPLAGAAGWRCDGLTDQLDVTATILDIAGLGPGEAHGTSLLPRIAAGPQAGGAGKEHVVAENHGVGMVRSARHKLIVSYRDRKPLEMYDLEEDPKEIANRVDDPALGPQRKRLLDAYLAAAPLLPIPSQPPPLSKSGEL